MKIKKNFMLRSVAGESIVIAVGDAAKDFGGMIKLNETGAFLWKQLESDSTEDALVKAMLGAYETDEETAKKDVKAFISALEKAELIEK